MKTTTKSKKVFKAVDFMREVRNELSKEFLKDKNNYMKHLKESLEDFKLQQLKA